MSADPPPNQTTRRIRRTHSFSASLEVNDPEFLQTPAQSLRNRIMNRVLDELVDELNHSDECAENFIRGGSYAQLSDRTNCAITDAEIMEDWQIPVMRRMSHLLDCTGDVLEVGFGRGISAGYLQELHPRSHTIIECNSSVVERFETWRENYRDRNIRLIVGRWQDVLERLESYDGILFHTYPLDQQELIEHAQNNITFAQPFFSVAAKHLRRGGRFTYFTNEVSSISRAHQRLLYSFFDGYSTELMHDLAIPEDTQDVLWARSLVLVTAFLRGAQQ